MLWWASCPTLTLVICYYVPAPLCKSVKPVFRLCSSSIAHASLSFPAPRKPPTVAIPQTFVLVLPGIFHQVAHTLGQAPATSARPVAGYQNIFCAASKLLAKLKNILA